jgi:uncharacterized protein YndB with AHSA1/START domain
MTSSTDRIVKTIFLRAPRAKVWRAISDSTEFGRWFGMRLDGPFVPGAVLHGRIVSTEVDPAVAKAQQPHEGLPLEITVDRVEPERLLSFRWHPHAVDRSVDYSTEPTTLIVFELADKPGGIQLTVTESGFDGIPLSRRARALEANGEGWGLVIGLVEKYLAQTA